MFKFFKNKSLLALALMCSMSGCLKTFADKRKVTTEVKSVIDANDKDDDLVDLDANDENNDNDNDKDDDLVDLDANDEDNDEDNDNDDWEALTTNDNFSSSDWCGKLDDSVKLGDMILPNAHDALAQAGKMTMLGTQIGDSFANCQSLNLTDQSKSGILVFDVRVSRSKKGGKNFWQGYHETYYNSDDAVKEIANLIRERGKIGQPIILKTRTKNGNMKEFLKDLDAALGNKLESYLYTPDDARFSGIDPSSLGNVNLGSMRLLSKFVFVLPDKENTHDPRVWDHNYTSLFSSDQKTAKNADELMDGICKKIESAEKDGKLLGITPAMTGNATKIASTILSDVKKDILWRVAGTTYKQISDGNTGRPIDDAYANTETYMDEYFKQLKDDPGLKVNMLGLNFVNDIKESSPHKGLKKIIQWNLDNLATRN